MKTISDELKTSKFIKIFNTDFTDVANWNYLYDRLISNNLAESIKFKILEEIHTRYE